MKYVISVSKTHKHRGKLITHRENTKKHWHIYYYEYDEIDEATKMYCKQVSFLSAMYYKTQKVKKIDLMCPVCNTTYTHFVKKRTDKHIMNEECPDCFTKFKDIEIEL